MLALNLAPRPLHRALVRAGYGLAYGRSAVARRAAELEQSQWWSAERLREQQWDKLQRLVTHAYQNVPYYRRAIDELGLRPADIRTPGDYARLPLLSKADINAHQEDLIAQDRPRERLIKTASGGSTGAPVALYHDPEMVAGWKAAKLRNFRWVGWQPGDAWARLWGSQFDVAPHRRLRQQLWDSLTRVLILPVWEFGEQEMERYAQALRRFHPDVIEAYVTPMYHFARFVEARGIDDIRPRGIICSAEMLFPHQRECIERAFHCKVYNRYGGREMGDVAHECSAGTMHLNTENLYVEFVRDDRPAHPGEPGEIVLTALNLYGFPLLRYRVEDVGSPSDAVCVCGRGLPAMEMVEGRVQDLITLPGGRFLPGEFFPHLFKDFDVLQFQVLQDQIDHLLLRVVRGPRLTDEQLEYLLAKVHEYTEGVVVELEFCAAIPNTSTGKFRYTISQVPPTLTATPEKTHA